MPPYQVIANVLKKFDPATSMYTVIGASQMGSSNGGHNALMSTNPDVDLLETSTIPVDHYAKGIYLTKVVNSKEEVYTEKLYKR